jgi:predicted nucleotidyltransferase
MQSAIEELRQRRSEILGLAAKHGAREVRVFGSIARNESTEASDIDLLMKMEKGRSFLDFVGLWQDLEDVLDCRVDLVSEGGVSPYLRDEIKRDAVPI